MVNNADSWFVAFTLKDSDDEDDGRSIQQQIYSSLKPGSNAQVTCISKIKALWW